MEATKINFQAQKKLGPVASAILNAATDTELDKSKEVPHTIFLPTKLGVLL